MTDLQGLPSLVNTLHGVTTIRNAINRFMFVCFFNAGIGIGTASGIEPDF
jgi:hypothetical protein